MMNASSVPRLGLKVTRSLQCCAARRLQLLFLLSISYALKTFSFQVFVPRRSCHLHPHRSVGGFQHISFVTKATSAERKEDGQQQQSSEMLVDMFSDQFDRWRFLQELLEGDASLDVVNQVIYEVLDGALKFPRYDAGGEKIILPANNQDCIESLVESFAYDGRIPVLINTDYDETGEDKESALTILEQLESLLPTPDEDEDAYKSSWDTVMEIHGREAVKYHETKNPTGTWKRSCVVARLLLHFDFLTLGIVKSPLQE